MIRLPLILPISAPVALGHGLVDRHGSSGGIPAGYIGIRIGSPASYQTVRIGVLASYKTPLIKKET